MTTFSIRAALWDARLQGGARAIGAQRMYFDAREYARAKREKLDLSGVAESGVLFVHVPKCAGTTIIRQRPEIAHGHRSASFFAWRDPALFARCFTFGSVRNPYDRLVSAFHYLRSDKTSVRDGAFGTQAVGHYKDFQEFVADLGRASARARCLGWVHFLPQTYYLCDRRGRVLVDYVARTETFADDLAHVNEVTGLGLDNIRERSVSRAKWPEFYDSRAARIAEDIYAEDFDTFGYDRL